VLEPDNLNQFYKQLTQKSSTDTELVGVNGEIFVNTCTPGQEGTQSEQDFHLSR